MGRHFLLQGNFPTQGSKPSLASPALAGGFFTNSTWSVKSSGPQKHHPNKASGGDGIPGEPFQILEDDAVKVLHSICQQIWKALQWPQDWKKSVFIPIPKKGNAKECSNYHTIALISYASKVMLNIRQARLHQYVNWELPDVQGDFRKGRGTRDQIANKSSHKAYSFIILAICANNVFCNDKCMLLLKPAHKKLSYFS